MSEANFSNIAEVQGVYGPFSFPESLLQKIWLRGEFNQSSLRTTDGQALEIVHPGVWNRLGGPDFRGARLRIGGKAIDGDVELHLYADDWVRHRHESAPSYENVVLHVVLFPPSAGQVTHGVHGCAIPILALLPLLHHDLEEYAENSVVERLANRYVMPSVDALRVMPPDELASLLRGHAEARWRLKRHFASVRIARLGWVGACHHTTLEILGYRFNRIPMLRVAGCWPLEAWGSGGVTADKAFDSEAGRWIMQGVRPANLPRVRLRQYETWVRTVPDWPMRLAALAEQLPRGLVFDGALARVRREHQLAALRLRFEREICGGAVSGTRLDNLICDGWLPLLAAHGAMEFAGLWFHWFPGDAPALLRQALFDLGVCSVRRRPVCHGLIQGLLDWMLAREREEFTVPPETLGRGA